MTRARAVGVRWALALGVAFTAAFGATAVEAAPPAPSPANAPADEVRAALEGWRLDAAEAGLAKVTGDTKVVLQARLDLQRARFDAVIAKLDGRVGALGYEARVLLGRALQAVGKRDEAFRVLDAMADDYNDDKVTAAGDLMWLGVGLMLTDYPKNALRVFKEALAKDPTLTAAKLAWAELFFSKYNYQDADPLFAEVLAKEPTNLRAAVGRARVAIESDRAFAEAEALLGPLVAQAPDCVPCHNVLALIDLHNERPEATVERLESRSLKVAPNDPEALALLGAARYLMDDVAGYRAVERRMLAVNPKAADFYATVAEHAEREHRYVEAIDLLERALALDPEHWNALSMLGTGYSRTGDDERAKDTLARAFDGDSFNVRTYNLLAHFYDKVDKHFEWVDAGPMQVRVDKQERPILEKVVPPLLMEAHKALSKKWGFEPKKPLHVEIFADPQTFAVRSTGLPGLAAHGICFGHVITARSPSAGDFNWAEVLWHELAHVYHLQLSKGRIPRWFTEGLAVYESTEGRPAWEREQDGELRAALKAKKLRGIADFNLAFTQARSLGEIVLAYYHAFQVTRFIHAEWGFPKAKKMVALWGDKKSTPEVFQAALGVDLAEFDRRFFAWLERELAYLDKAYPFDLRGLAERGDEVLAKAKPSAPDAKPSAQELAEGAAVLLARRDPAGAMALADAALRDGEAPLARFVRAMAGLGDKARAAEVKADLEALRAIGKAGVDGLTALARMAEDGATEPGGDAVALWREAVAADPKDEALHAGLIAALDRKKDAAGAFAARLALMRVDQMNARLALETLGKAAEAKAKRPEVERVAEQARHIAPFSLEVHLATARALSAVGDKAGARQAAGLALILAPEHPEAKALAAP